METVTNEFGTQQVLGYSLAATAAIAVAVTVAAAVVVAAATAVTSVTVGRAGSARGSDRSLSSVLGRAGQVDVATATALAVGVAATPRAP
jgi:hypothetical protein